MFHRFSATPAKGRGQSSQSSAAARTKNGSISKHSGNHSTSSSAASEKLGGDNESHSLPNLEHTVLPLAKRQKTARACDRCRLHRIKCDEQKPCTQCISIKAKCIVSYAPPRASGQQSGSANNSNTAASAADKHIITYRAIGELNQSRVDGGNANGPTEVSAAIDKVRRSSHSPSHQGRPPARTSEERSHSYNSVSTNSSAGLNSRSGGSSGSIATVASVSTAQTSPVSPVCAPPSRMSTGQDHAWSMSTDVLQHHQQQQHYTHHNHQSSSASATQEYFDLTAQMQDFFTQNSAACSHTSAFTSGMFPQLPYLAMPSGERSIPTSVLLKSQRNYYMRLFWDVCHPLFQIMSEAEFAELDNIPLPGAFETGTVQHALVDAMVALGIQHSHASGLAGRVLGLPQYGAARQYYHAAAANAPEGTWPGFEYFNRCRDRMRTNEEVSLDALRAHALMVLYLVKGNAFRDAYNLLGITIRKAYIAKLHRLPSTSLPEAARTAHMQLWWMLFSLDLQCSLQLDTPAACQKSLVKCPLPAPDALARYVASPGMPAAGGNSASTYAIRMIHLAVIVTDIGACVSSADLVDDDENSPAALEQHSRTLSDALQHLDMWRAQLPPDLLLSRLESNPDVVDFDRDLTRPAWLQRQAVLLELQYHNSFVLIQRPFIKLRYGNATGDDHDMDSMLSPSAESGQSHADIHIASALHHALVVVDTVFAVCSRSDVLYGWSEVLQPLWNATLTILAYVSAAYNSHNSNNNLFSHHKTHTTAELLLQATIPRALDALPRAQAIFDAFSPTSPTALAARDIVNSLTTTLQAVLTQVPLSSSSPCAALTATQQDDPMAWDLFAALLDEHATVSPGPMLDTSGGSGFFSPFMSAAAMAAHHMHSPTADFHSSVVMGFGDV